MKLLTLLGLVLSSSMAFANTYVCQNEKRDIKVRVNDTIMVLSRPSVNVPNKTIATFGSDEESGELLKVRGSPTSKNGKIYSAKVDLRYAGSNSGGEDILGTNLDQLSKIVVTVKENSKGKVVDAYIGVAFRQKGRRGTWAPLTCE